MASYTELQKEFEILNLKSNVIKKIHNMYPEINIEYEDDIDDEAFSELVTVFEEERGPEIEDEEAEREGILVFSTRNLSNTTDEKGFLAGIFDLLAIL